MREINPSIFVIHSFNFVDFEDKEVPLKSTATGPAPSDLMGYSIEIDIDLDMVFTAFKESLINPFEDLGGNESEFFKLKSIDIEITATEN